MKCSVRKGFGGFYPILIRGNDTLTYFIDSSLYLSGEFIASFLESELEEYIKIIIQNGGYRVGFAGHYLYRFKTKQQCQKFIEEFIEPRLVMKELIK